jgi:hypothetical protein
MASQKIRIAALLVLVAAVALSAWLARPAPLAVTNDLDAALADAKAKGAWVVVHVRRADRPLGAKMDAETLAEPEVARQATEGLLHVRLAAPAAADATDSATALRIERLAGPGAALATLVLNEEGEVVAELDGFATAAELLEFLDRVRARRGELLDPATPRIRRAELLFELGALAFAERLVAEIDAAGGDDPGTAARALLLHGQIELRRGHVEAAAQALRDVTARYPATPSAGEATRLLGTLPSR